MPSTRARGLDAEALAAAHLIEAGLSLLTRNFIARCGELDLVCLESGVLVIVEVRLRSNTRFGGALASVTAAKQHRIIRATQVFLQKQRRWRECRIRFDVVGIESASDGLPSVTWVRDAFRPR